MDAAHVDSLGEVMGTVIADMSMSLDGFSTGPNDGPHNPMGEGGDRLHEWMAGLGDWGERLVPVLLGGGVRLFDRMGPEHIELDCARVVDAPGVTHLARISRRRAITPRRMQAP
jgi:hypothetical protein